MTVVDARPGRCDESAVSSLVDRARKVPDRYREFAVSSADASRIFGVDATLLQQLLDLGLPHKGRGADRCFDRWDLENAGLELGIPCPRRTAMRWWSQSLAECDRDADRAYLITMTAQCPHPGHQGSCEMALHPAVTGSSVEGSHRRPQPNVFQFEIRLAAPRWYFGEPFTELIKRVAGVRFHLLPKPLKQDLGFVEATGLADCQLATSYFARLGQRMGLEVRGATGVFVGIPYSVPHCWLEFRDGPRWLAADPFLLTAFARWGISDPQRWPANRSPQGVLWRPTGEREVPLVTHQGEEVAMSFVSVPCRVQGGRIADRSSWTAAGDHRRRQGELAGVR